jgi:hypothetical protein
MSIITAKNSALQEMADQQKNSRREFRYTKRKMFYIEGKGKGKEKKKEKRKKSQSP